MPSEKMQKALNAQIRKEYYSAYLYMSMAAWFENEGLDGFANWMRIQTQEELAHGTIFFNYLCERGARVRLEAIDAPPSDFDSPLDIFEKSLEHERTVTASINELMDLAIDDRDHASASMLKWFVDEQVEEEASADDIRGKLERVGDGGGLYMLDQKLAARVFTTPSPLAGEEA